MRRRGGATVVGAGGRTDNTAMRRLTPFALVTALTAAHLFAQDEAITLRLSPRPNQVIHFSIEQEVTTTMEGVPFDVHGRTRSTLTQTVATKPGIDPVCPLSIRPPVRSSCTPSP